MAISRYPDDDGALAASRRSRIALLQVDAGLLAAVPERERPLAERRFPSRATSSVPGRGG